MPPISAKTWAVFLIACGILLSAATDAYLLEVSAGGTAVWSEEEAYFFVGRSIQGYHTEWIKVPFRLAIEFLGAIQPPNDGSASFHVIHVTLSGAEHHVPDIDLTPGRGPRSYTPIEGRIWAHSSAFGGLCWWAGDHFQPATEEEKRRLSRRLDMVNKVEAPWSKRTLGAGPRGNITIRLRDSTELSVMGGTGLRGPFRIEMRRPGQETKVLYNVERRAGIASRSEYLRVFPRE